MKEVVMSCLSRENIESIVMKGKDKNYSHVIIYMDHFEYEYFSRYVKVGENPKEIISKIKSGGSPGMFTIEEVYNYNLDLNSQLNEDRAYHIEPLEKKEKVNKVEENDNTFIFNLPKVIEAFEFAKKMHEGQTRNDGTPYINHPIRVANLVASFKESTDLETLIICAYLHDTLEQTEATYYDIVKIFGYKVGSILMELTTDEDLKKEMGKTNYLKIKMKNMSSWALVVKLCDRLDNVSDLVNSSEEFQVKYINETIKILEYLVENRELSKTHIFIIKQIISKLILINKQEENLKVIYCILKNINNIECMKKDNMSIRKLNSAFSL